MTSDADMQERPRPYADRVDAHGTVHLTPNEFATCFQSAWPTLWSIAVAVLSGPTGADDVLQEAAMIALGKLDQFDSRTNFAAWMGKIVRFVALNHGRRKANAVAANIDPQSIEASVEPHDDRDESVIDGRGQLIDSTQHFDDRVLMALQSLEETARACLLLRTLMNMPYRDIALALDIAQGTAMSHVHRARTALRERLSPHPHTKIETVLDD